MKKTVLITGCSSGFGKALCDEFSKQNYYVIATARKIENLSEYRKIYERDLMFSKKQTKSDVFNCARRLIHMDRCKKLIKRRIVSVILFVFALYLTEFSPFSGRAVALFNGGYGTFDMKKYDADVFTSVMNATRNASIYWKHYICDFIFKIALFDFMIQMVTGFKGEFIIQILSNTEVKERRK